MKKVLLRSVLFVVLFSVTGFSQWSYQGAWPDTNYKGGTHGIAVDPDGKVWTASYYKTNWIAPDTVAVSPILVFNADGSFVDTIYTVTTGAVTDTLKGNCRGLGVAADGNILYVQSGTSKILKINYQTLQGMARHDITEIGSSPTGPSASLDGTIYVGPVVGGGTTAIATYDTDLNYLGNAVTGPANIARTMIVSPDGLSIYWTMFTGGMGIDIYTRPDELGSFALADSALRGMSIETVAWNPATGNLWVSNDSRGVDKSYTHLTWYEYNVTTKALVDSFTLPSPDPVPADEFPRGLRFSPDGSTAYVGLFGTKYSRIYKFTKSAATTVDVTFQVDMSVPIAKGSFNPASDTVFVRGSFNGWGKTAMTDGDNDSVWVVTLPGQPQSTPLAYKYFYNAGDTWESGDNREVNTGTSATLTLPRYFFDLNPDYFDGRTPYTGTTSTVTFNVDMHLPLKGAMETSDHVYIAGNFTDWGNGALEMLDANADSIYSVDVPTFTSGYLPVYKFIWSTGGAATGSWEAPSGADVFGGDNNRIYGVVDGQDTVSRFWENADPNVTLGDGNILFICDMSAAAELGVFNPSVDSVQIRGSFNSWNDSDPPRSLMNQDAGNPNIWFLNVSFVQQELNSNMFYKYFIKNGAGSTPYSNTGWEVAIDPTTYGNRDRPITFLGSDTQEAGYEYFEGIHTDWVVPTGTSIQATFSVDMTPAAGFNPATDSVVWIPRQPFYYAVHGISWPGDYPRVLYLTDANSDMVYEGTLTINGPDFNGFLYNYGYANAGGLTQEGGSQEECRVRYVGMTAPRTFVSPYSFPQDVWTDGQKPEEASPLVGIKDIDGGLLKSFALEQNYPNPFNPSTTIRFSIPDAGLVNISVYNLLGEKVGEVLNQDLASGSYEVSFNASHLSSGVYLFTLTSGNYTATKKMLLLK